MTFCGVWKTKKYLTIDHSAAFVTGDHNILHRFGAIGKSLDWFNSYLCPRAFKVCIGEKYSKEIILPFCVPQGRCFPSALYTVYFSILELVINSTNQEISSQFPTQNSDRSTQKPKQAYWDMQMTMLLRKISSLEHSGGKHGHTRLWTLLWKIK